MNAINANRSNSIDSIQRQRGKNPPKIPKRGIPWDSAVSDRLRGDARGSHRHYLGPEQLRVHFNAHPARR